jgi:hypothetical protein
MLERNCGYGRFSEIASVRQLLTSVCVEYMRRFGWMSSYGMRDEVPCISIRKSSPRPRRLRARGLCLSRKGVRPCIIPLLLPHRQFHIRWIFTGAIFETAVPPCTAFSAGPLAQERIPSHPLPPVALGSFTIGFSLPVTSLIKPHHELHASGAKGWMQHVPYGTEMS